MCSYPYAVFSSAQSSTEYPLAKFMNRVDAIRFACTYTEVNQAHYAFVFYDGEQYRIFLKGNDITGTLDNGRFEHENRGKSTVSVYVRGGVVQEVDCPANVIVDVFDFDVDDGEGNYTVEGGNKCNLTTWE